MKWRDPDTLTVYEHYYDEQKFRDLHEKLQENYLKREKEYYKSVKSRSRINKPLQHTSIELESLNENSSWLSEFYEGMEP